VPDAGCIEKAHLVEALLEAFARPRPPASLSLRSIAQPTQCAICMSAFKEGDLLRQLSCSELCAPQRPPPLPPPPPSPPSPPPSPPPLSAFFVYLSFPLHPPLFVPSA